MKFQRRLSEPHIVLLQEPPPNLTNKRLWRFIGAFLPAVWQSVLKLIMGSAEPIFEKHVDSSGQVLYTIYDPVTQQQVNGLSEHDARVWLEQRYYQ